jgi:hypothetical protein
LTRYRTVSALVFDILIHGHRTANDRIIRLIRLTFGVNETWLKTGKGEMFHSALEIHLFFCYCIKVRVFKYPRFSRFAGKEGITDHELLEIVDQLEGDQADANLGGDVYKVRVARPGEGKSGGHRVIVYFRNEFRTFFSYGFSKSYKDNISAKDLKLFKHDAKKDFGLTDIEIKAWLDRGTLFEITEEDVHRVAMMRTKGSTINTTAHAVKKED